MHKCIAEKWGSDGQGTTGGRFFFISFSRGMGDKEYPGEIL